MVLETSSHGFRDVVPWSRIHPTVGCVTPAGLAGTVGTRRRATHRPSRSESNSCQCLTTGEIVITRPELRARLAETLGSPPIHADSGADGVGTPVVTNEASPGQTTALVEWAADRTREVDRRRPEHAECRQQLCLWRPARRDRPPRWLPSTHGLATYSGSEAKAHPFRGVDEVDMI